MKLWIINAKTPKKKLNIFIKDLIPLFKVFYILWLLSSQRIYQLIVLFTSSMSPLPVEEN